MTSKATKPQQAEPEPETHEQRLSRLEAKRAELFAEYEAATRRVQEAEEQDAVDAVMSGKSIDEAVRSGREQEKTLMDKIAVLDRAIRGQAQLVQGEKVMEARKEREKQRPEFQKAIRKYLEAVREILPVWEAVRAFDEFRVAPLILPGINGLQDLDRQLAIFADSLQLRGIDPATCGITVAPKRERPVKELSQEAKRNMAERYPQSVLASDMPKLRM